MANEQQRQFLPDLCTAQAVLVVVVVAQLLAIVTTLTAALYSSFSFERLALSSLFIQWVALTSAALLCGVRATINRMPLGWAGAVVVMVVVIDAFCFSLLAGLALECCRKAPGKFLFEAWKEWSIGVPGFPSSYYISLLVSLLFVFLMPFLCFVIYLLLVLVYFFSSL